VWTAEQDAYLIANWGRCSLRQMMRETGRAHQTVKHRAAELGLIERDIYTRNARGEVMTSEGYVTGYKLVWGCEPRCRKCGKEILAEQDVVMPAKGRMGVMPPVEHQVCGA
jgi:hypothetical protein